MNFFLCHSEPSAAAIVRRGRAEESAFPFFLGGLKAKRLLG